MVYVFEITVKDFIIYLASSFHFPGKSFVIS